MRSQSTDPITGEPVLLLDLLMALSCLAGVAWSLHLLDRSPDATTGLVFGGMVLMLAALWIARRLHRRHRRDDSAGLVIVFAVVAAAGPFVSDGSGSWPLFLMSLILVASRFSPSVAAVEVTVVVLAIAGWYVAVGRPPGAVLSGTLGAAYVFGFGLVLAWLITAYARQQRRIASLLGEVRHGMRLEHELVLAEERTRAARDLHDGLGQQLTLVIMNLRYAERMRDRETERSWRQVEEARGAATEALEVMRRWVRALSPAGPSEADADEPVDLARSLEAVVDRFRRTGLQVEVVVEIGPPTRDVSLFAHRFVQEGLTNALRHADADHVRVSCRHSGRGLVLAVEDNGSGGGESPHRGFGLRSLQERAAALGGELLTCSTASGFVLQARLP